MKPVDLRLEKDIQKDVVEFWRGLGCVVAILSQGYRAAGTRQTPGIPDLYVFPPLRRGPLTGSCIHDHNRVAFWFECKSPSGKQSAAQRKWQLLCSGRGTHYLIGGMDVAIQYAVCIGLLAR